MSELAPGGSNARMTKSQVNKYLHDMKKAQDEAKKKLAEAEKNWELNEDTEQLEKNMDKMLDEL